MREHPLYEFQSTSGKLMSPISNMFLLLSNEFKYDISDKLYWSEELGG